MNEISGGVCAAKGFLASGIRCGIKPASQKKDLALIYSQKPCAAAAVFTANKVKAASVQLTREHIAAGKLHAVIANSGNANACTGNQGMADARRMAQLAANELSIEPSQVAVASTGVIGVPLPIAAIESGVKELKAALSGGGNADALEAIMTTDTRRKETAVEISIGGKPVRIGAMTKGSGMIHPNMATMLAFITTDAAIEQGALDKSLRSAVKHSFNRLTVDGDTSTNDMALIMANGEAQNPPISAAGESYEVFCAALEHVCIMLTREMARDGEGATKLVTVTVACASTEEDAAALAKSVAASSLVKAACFGADANWGRVLCAMGYSGVDFDPSKVAVKFISRAGEIQVCKNGEAVPFSEEKAKLILLEDEIEIMIHFQEGGLQEGGLQEGGLQEGDLLEGGKASVWGCDLTYDYVKINGDYRS